MIHDFLIKQLNLSLKFAINIITLSNQIRTVKLADLSILEPATLMLETCKNQVFDCKKQGPASHIT